MLERFFLDFCRNIKNISTCLTEHIILYQACVVLYILKLIVFTKISCTDDIFSSIFDSALLSNYILLVIGQFILLTKKYIFEQKSIFFYSLVLAQAIRGYNRNILYFCSVHFSKVGAFGDYSLINHFPLNKWFSTFFFPL